MMRDVLFGLLTWILMVGALVGTCVLCTYLFGPPIGDRGRSMAFIGGGGMLFIALLLLSFVTAVGCNATR